MLVTQIQQEQNEKEELYANVILDVVMLNKIETYWSPEINILNNNELHIDTLF